VWKFGGIGVTQGLALEYAEWGVCVAIPYAQATGSTRPIRADRLCGEYAKTFGKTEAEVRQHYIDLVPMKRMLLP